MDFKSVSKFGSYISKAYAEDLFRLLGKYSNISASEAASRLNLHIQTVQDFLEAMTSLGILSKEEVYEKKRPYHRYSIIKQKLTIDLDLFSTEDKYKVESGMLRRIREKNNANIHFKTSRDNTYISSLVIWTGEGRDKSERKINLTIPQGKFLYKLPFPKAAYQSIEEIMEKAGIGHDLGTEIIDIVDVLFEYSVIESENE